MPITNPVVLKECVVSTSCCVSLKCKHCRRLVQYFAANQIETDAKAQAEMETHLWEAHQLRYQTPPKDSKPTG
jgi:hypothetical protein